MLTTSINNIPIILYSSIKELTIARHKQMQNYLLSDSGIGNTMADFNQHLQNLSLFLNNQKHEEAREELVNLTYNFYSMIAGIDYKTKSFACLVREIDGKVYNDLSEDGLNLVVDKLTEIDSTNEQIDELFDSIKKKLMTV